MQRVVAACGQLPVGGDHDERVVVFDGDLDVAKVVFFEQGAFPQGGLDESLRGGAAVFGEQAGIQRACVDSDADRHVGVPSGSGDLGDLVVEAFNIARVDADRGAA